MRNTVRSFIIVMAVAVMFMGMAIPAFAGPEGTLVSKINSSRSAAGLAPLETYWDLTDDARAHSSRMMDKGSIYHNPSLGSVTGVWHALGENVGMGVDISGMHTAFMNSSGHRANILGNYNYVGVGVKTDSSGVHWVTVVFMKADPGLNGGGTTTTQAPATTTTTKAPATTTTTNAPATTTTKAPSPTTTKSPTTSVAPSQSSGANAADSNSVSHESESETPEGVAGWRFVVL